MSSPTLGPRRVLDGRAFRRQLENAIRAAKTRVLMFSAFLTAGGMDWFVNVCPPDVSVGIVARWRLSDILQGASDLQAYTIARSIHFDFRVNRYLHAKVWLIDQDILFVGSANATSRGLALIENNNVEFGTVLQPTALDVTMLHALFNDSVPVSKELFDQLSACVAEKLGGMEGKGSGAWPEHLAALMKPNSKPSSMWVSDLFSTDGGWIAQERYDLTPEIRHDISLLGADDLPTSKSDRISLARTLLMESIPFQWLHETLEAEPSHEAYFGRLSSSLHSVLEGDPRPRRQEVKQLLANLLSWIEVLGPGEIVIDRPSYSQRVSLARKPAGLN